MRVLVYGFGPYRQFRENITARIIKSLPRSSEPMTKIFPVRFHPQQFIAVLDGLQPDIILGLGQSTRRQIAVETRARNRRRAGKTTEVRMISRDGPRSLPTTLPIRAGRWIRRSTDAGDYVCNYSMYLLLDAIERERRKVRFGFIHIPYDYQLDKAVQVVRRVLRQFRRGG